MDKCLKQRNERTERGKQKGKGGQKRVKRRAGKDRIKDEWR